MQVERSGVEALNAEIIIRPELPIGTELWFMRDNKMWIALVAAYRVDVTSFNDKEEHGWYHQLYFRWLKKKQKEYWRYSFQYTIKIDADYHAYALQQKKDGFYISDKKCFLTKEALLQSL